MINVAYDDASFDIYREYVSSEATEMQIDI